MITNSTSRFALIQIFLDRTRMDEVTTTYMVKAPSDYGVQRLSSVFTSSACSGYRYGFQAQEKDDEVKGKGNSVNYTYRMHDTRLGRFFCTDPIGYKYPHNSPYAFSENRVIDKIELEGLEAWDPKNAKVDVMSLSDFGATVKNEIIPIAIKRQEELQFDCNDLALFVVMKYFEIKEVEFSVTVSDQLGKRTYSSSDPKYKDFDEFYGVVRLQIGSEYTQKKLSFHVSPEEAVAGDIIVSDYHTNVYLGPADKPGNANTIKASGMYYGKGHPDNTFTPLEYGDYYEFNDISKGKLFELKRWNMMSDVPRDLQVNSLEMKQPTVDYIDSGAGGNKTLRQFEYGPRKEDGSF